jgi:hypothetical protein
VQQVQQQQVQPRRDLQQWQQLLQDEASSSAAEAGAPTHFNKEEGVKWLQGFAPEAHALLDKPFEEYFTYIQDKHGPHVLTCVMFFCLGHHDAFKGESLGQNAEISHMAWFELLARPTALLSLYGFCVSC